MTRFITADDVCFAAETTLRENLASVITTLGLDVAPTPPARPGKAFTPPGNWDQVPTLEALSSANFPAGAITSPGLTGPPVRRGRWGTGYDVTWRLAVGIYDRGRTYNETASRNRTWAALVRATMLQHPTLGGLVSSLTWVGEEYRQIPGRAAAKTLGGCAVAFDVIVENVVDLSADPTVSSAAQPDLTVQPAQE